MLSQILELKLIGGRMIGLRRMGEVIPMFGEHHITPEMRAHLIQRVTDLAIEISLLESEKQRLEQRLEEGK